MKNFLKFFKDTTRKLALKIVYLYQATISPDHGPVKNYITIMKCRFYPTCSAYAAESIRQYGLLKGSMASIKRIIRCNPFCAGGYDPVCTIDNDIS